ncbi:CsiV family protein [Arsukibacterium sp.]|uniref:CsiV family protein n=1 Tax=Arsukibacterium sp. TaxID=1977258 RepID=UPI002FDADEF3
MMIWRSISLISLVVASWSLTAQERWFEIELIVFQRDNPSALKEQFSETVTPIRLGRSADLRSAQLQPDIQHLLANLPECQHSDSQLNAEPQPAISRQLAAYQQLCIGEAAALAWQRQQLFPAQQFDNRQPMPEQLPVQLIGAGVHQSGLYLGASEDLQLTELATKIQRQRQHQLLLHTLWRQAPVTERRALPSRWFSGRNFSQQFDYWGQPLAAQYEAELPLSPLQPEAIATESAADMFSSIESLLQQLEAGSGLPPLAQQALAIEPQQNLISNLPDQVWQLDGLFKLHLDHYLFVNTEFNLRRLHPAKQGPELKTIYVKHNRRVISGELHYLDHPHLGIVLQIRRFEPPSNPE